MYLFSSGFLSFLYHIKLVKAIVHRKPKMTMAETKWDFTFPSFSYWSFIEGWKKIVWVFFGTPWL
jgi:hypothetical protein